MYWHIGHNDSGCSPDDPESILTADDRESAVNILTEELKSLASDYESRCEQYGNMENTIAGTVECCGWCEVWFDVYKETSDANWAYEFLKSERQTVNLIFSPPEGADVVYWIVPCENPLGECKCYASSD